MNLLTKFSKVFPILATTPTSERLVVITNDAGSDVLRTTVTAPVAWSDDAVKILAHKYLRKAGVPSDLCLDDDASCQLIPLLFTPMKPAPGATFGGETSVLQVITRMVGAWTYWGLRGGQLIGKSEAMKFMDRMLAILVNQRGAPNSPQWFNTGLHWAYGISGPPQGHWTTNLETKIVEQSTSAYERPQPHACFIQSVTDDLVNEGGIMDLFMREARVFKYGSGTGTNFSALRGSGEPLSGGGKSSGLLSFLKIGDAAAGSIKSGGTTRRAAKMVVLDADHPDIHQFTWWKAREEEKVAALIAGSWSVQDSWDGGAQTGVPTSYLSRIPVVGETHRPKPITADWQGEGYTTVSGQNANNSVRVTDRFMQSAGEDGTHRLRWRTDPKKGSEVSAKWLWDEICKAAWCCGDPGLQFHDTINAWNTCENDGQITASNPCSEYMFLDDTGCNLASIRLTAYLDDDDGGRWNAKLFQDDVALWTTVLDISVGMAQYPSRTIAERSWKYRTLGLGYADLGSLLMRLGIPYASNEATATCGAITSLMTACAYRTSAMMAARLGAFPGYADNSKATLRVLAQHSVANQGTRQPTLRSSGRNRNIDLLGLSVRCDEAWNEALALAAECGVRNAQVTLIAPTGTIALVMGCDTTGIEPDFTLVKSKELAGGGSLRIVNQSVDPGLRALGYSQAERERLVKLLEDTGVLDVPAQHKAVFACALGDHPISWTWHIYMMAAAQPFLSGAISKTINLPASASVLDVSDAYRLGWECGLKSMALFRDGCKFSQPLRPAFATTSSEVKTSSPPATVSNYRPLPTKRNGYTQKMEIDGHTLFLRTGEYPDGTLGEVFLTIAKDGSTLRSFMDALGVAISVGLQHGVPLRKFVNKLSGTKSEPHGFVHGHETIKVCSSLLDAVARDLELNYLMDQAATELPPVQPKQTGGLCGECGHFTMVKTGSCDTCSNCGANTGCG